jgi:hypothetical protein
VGYPLRAIQVEEPRVTTKDFTVFNMGLTTALALGWQWYELPLPCSHHVFLPCLFWVQGMNSRTNTPVETWKGSKGKQSYTYIIEENATMSFTWAFQRTTLHETVSPTLPMLTSAKTV